MKIYVNDRLIEILPGMKVRHALIQAGLITEAEAGRLVYDEWGNELGLDGALSEGMKIFLK
ncbi:MAG: hypothetical protein HZA17_03415 [Nitrospirae bacterium]|nr:hypothetical protein [Nitrospirota bacterium]